MAGRRFPQILTPQCQEMLFTNAHAVPGVTLVADDTDPRHIFDTLYAPLKHAFHGVVLGVSGGVHLKGGFQGGLGMCMWVF